MFEPLYPGSTVSVCGGVCAIMHFCTTSKLSYTAISELLKLLQVLCPVPNSLPTTVYRLKQFFKQYNLKYNIHQYCSECLNQVNDCHCSEASRKMCHVVDAPIEKPLEIIISSKFYAQIDLKFVIFVYIALHV